MRGEHVKQSSPVQTLGGSSPHARGARIQNIVLDPRVRLIPACAGSTSPGTRGATGSRAHPRMRGEHSAAGVLACLVAGSSPHARGAQGSCGEGPVSDRLIPACAGSTVFLPRDELHLRAHPRMRGEHPSIITRPARVAGSSPHARGAPVVHVRLGGGVGLIPACAGSTRTGRPPMCSGLAHPRMRGEHRLSVPTFEPGPGSSPHARGAPNPHGT